VNSNAPALTLSKDVFEIALNPYFKERVMLYGARDYVSLGIPEETFNTMAKSLGYVPALVRGTSDDMALLMYQILVIALMFGDVSANNQAKTSTQFVSVTKGVKNAWVVAFDKMLVWP
jgi:hypothetical protein